MEGLRRWLRRRLQWTGQTSSSGIGWAGEDRSCCVADRRYTSLERGRPMAWRVGLGSIEGYGSGVDVDARLWVDDVGADRQRSRAVCRRSPAVDRQVELRLRLG